MGGGGWGGRGRVHGLEHIYKNQKRDDDDSQDDDDKGDDDDHEDNDKDDDVMMIVKIMMIRMRAVMITIIVGITNAA